MGDLTRATLRRRVLEHLGPYVSGTVTASVSTVACKDSSRIEPDDKWVNFYLFITDTTDDLAPEDEIRLVTNFVQSTGQLTVSPAFSAAPEAADIYDLCARQPSHVDWAIDDAVRDAWPGWYKDVVDKTTLDSAADTWEYSLPAEASILLDVWLEDTDGARIEVPGWLVRDQPGGRTLAFEAVPQNVYDMGLHYAERPALATASTATLNVGATGQTTPEEENCGDYIVARALELIFSRDYNQSGDETDWNQLRLWRENRGEARKNSMAWPSGTARGIRHKEQGALDNVERMI